MPTTLDARTLRDPMSRYREALSPYRAAAQRSPKKVEVLATGSMAHGLSVAAAFVPDAADVDTRGSMLGRMQGPVSGALIRASYPHLIGVE